MAPLLRLAAAALLTLTSFVAAQDDPIPLVCHTGVQIIAVVGANVTNGTQSYGRTLTFVKGVMAAIPDSSNISINYNRFPGNQSTAVTFIPEVNEGIPALRTALDSYTSACPETPIVLHGYSQGAVVVMNLLCGASSGMFPPTSPDPSYVSHIISVILYGDESRTANQSYNEGGCTASGPHLARRKPENCAAYAPTIQSYCLDDDPDCCSTANATAPWPGGINPHWLYPNDFDVNATDFVVAQYSSYTSSLSATTSTSTISTKSSTTTTSSKTTSTSKTTVTTSKSSSTTPKSTSTASKTTSTSTKPTTTSTSTKPTTTSTSTKPTTASTSTKPTTTSTSTSTSTKPTTTSTSTSTKPTTTSTKPTTTSTTSKSSTPPTTITTSTKLSTKANPPSTTTTSDTKIHTTLSMASTCTPDRCLSSFQVHPVTASRFCNKLATGTPLGTPFPSVCSPSYAANVVSACACLGFARHTGAVA